MNLTYRCVCPVCTAYIRSEVGQTQDEWDSSCKQWLAEKCPHKNHDGIENHTQYRLVIGEDSVVEGEHFWLLV